MARMTQAERVREELATRRAEANMQKEELKAQRMFKKELLAEKKKESSKLEKFANKVESQNVKGVIPSVENRGVHNIVVFNPFNSPEKELVRDQKTGLLSVKENRDDTPKRKSIWVK